MALSIVNQWNATDGPVDIQQVISPTSGNWLAAIVTWRTTTAAVQPVINVTDPSRNVWWLLATKTVQASNTYASSTGPLCVQVWACPAVAYTGWNQMRVYTAIQTITGSDLGSVDVKILEVAGMGNGFLTVDAVVTATAATANGVTLNLPAPAGGADCLMVAAAAGDIAYGSYSTTGTGWTQLSNTTNTNPECGLFSAWREATTSGSVTFNLAAGFNRNWAAVGVSIRQTGVVPTQSNPNWPLIETQIGFGYDLSTPPSAVWWTTLQNPVLSVSTKRGIGYELGAAQAEPTDITIRNADGALSPKTAVTASASAAGTATTIKVPDASASGIAVGDFFRLTTSAGALKEYTVFKVAALSSVSGTTTITFAPADGSAGGALAATASGDVYQGVPVDIYTPYRQLATWGGKRHYVSAGWAERWPETWTSDGLVGVMTMTGTGALANLTATDPTSLAGEIMRRSPYAYWPLNDAAGAPSATNVSGRSVAHLVQVTSKVGSGAKGSAAFGASTSGVQDPSSGVTSTLLGDPGSCWFQTGLTSAELNSGDGFALLGRDSGFPSITNGVTVFLVVQSPGDSTIFNSTINPTIVAVKNTDPGNGAGLGNIIKLSVQHNGTNQGQPIVTVWDKSTHASTAKTCTSGSGVQNVDFTCVALTFNATSWACYGLNGTLEGSGSCNLTDKWTTIEVGGEADQFFNGNCYGSGRFAHVVVFDRVLTAAEIGQIDSAIKGHQGNEFTVNRVQRKLDTIGMTSGRALSYDGQKVAAAESGGSGTVGDLVNQIGAYEDALVFEDAGAGFQYRPPALSTVQTSRATLGERADLGEVPYQGGVVADFDATYIYNSITVTNSAVNKAAFQEDISDTLFTAIDSVSGGKYGLRTLDRGTRLNNPQDAFGLAYWLLSQYASRKRRISQVSIDPASNPSAFGFCLGVEVGDLVTVMRRPLSGVSSLLCVVLQVDHAFSPGAWKTTLTLTPARPHELILNDPTYGIVGSNVIGLE